MSKPMRGVFMGTPGFAEIILDRVLQSDDIEIIAAYTQPDRPAGRGQKLRAPEVKVLAKKHSIPVYQPANFKDKASIEELASLSPDILIVAAYGLILPQEVLDIPKFLPVNIHASLLPKYRGAAPIQRAIMNGEMVTGVTLMHMEKGLDTGPILMQQALGIDINDTSEIIHDELAEAGAELLLKFIPRLSIGQIMEINQEESLSSYASMLSKKDGDIDFNKTATEIHSLVRGVTPWPGARARLVREGEEKLYVGVSPGVYPFSSDELKEKENLKPGQMAKLSDNTLAVRCKDGWYAFNLLRPAGRKDMDGESFFNGYLAQNPDAYFE